MPNTREKLMRLLCTANSKATEAEAFEDATYAQQLGIQADHLISNGVTIQDDHHWATEQAYKNGYADGQPKWISVEERLPTPYERVLVCRGDLRSENKFICVEYLTVCYGETTMWGGDYETWKSKVTHWMPLPEAPKGE